MNVPLCLVAVALVCASTFASAQSVQEHVHGHGHEVMPFDLAQTVHVFRMTTYQPLPNGAEIRFRTRDIALVTAVHRWFGAQLSEHGADARAE